LSSCFIVFFQAEDGIRDRNVTGVQTCALPISFASLPLFAPSIASDAPLSSPTFSVDVPAPPAFPESEAVLSPLSPLSPPKPVQRSEEHTSELQSRFELVCRLLLEKINSSCCSHTFPFLRRSWICYLPVPTV